MQFAMIFRRTSSFQQYMKHLRWAHRFLRMGVDWDTPIVKQVSRGQLKMEPPKSAKLALQAEQARKLVKRASHEGNREQAAIYAVARMFLFRVPSEYLPLALTSSHSSVHIEGNVARVTLTKRKPINYPHVLERSCSCKHIGKLLCGVCWLKERIAHATEKGINQLFKVSVSGFRQQLRTDAMAVGISEAHRLGSHALRRGMARDSIDHGGSFAILLRAGEWRSSAYVAYLREHQAEEVNVASLLIDHSDSD